MASARLLAKTGWKRPDDNGHPTGVELCDRYVAPLAATDAMRKAVRYRHTVRSIGRAGIDKVKNAVKFASYPPRGKRSLGGGQYGTLWGSDYRQQANANIMIVAMIESPAGVEIADQIAAIPEVDVVFIASTDLGSFSGLKQGDPKYEALVTKAKDAILSKGKIVAGPLAWKERPGYHFFQGPGEGSLLRMGAKAALGGANEGAPKGVAVIEGTEKKQ